MNIYFTFICAFFAVYVIAETQANACPDDYCDYKKYSCLEIPSPCQEGQIVTRPCNCVCCPDCVTILREYPIIVGMTFKLFIAVLFAERGEKCSADCDPDNPPTSKCADGLECVDGECEYF